MRHRICRFHKNRGCECICTVAGPDGTSTNKLRCHTHHSASEPTTISGQNKPPPAWHRRWHRRWHRLWFLGFGFSFFLLSPFFFFLLSPVFFFFLSPVFFFLLSPFFFFLLSPVFFFLLLRWLFGQLRRWLFWGAAAWVAATRVAATWVAATWVAATWVAATWVAATRAGATRPAPACRTEANCRPLSWAICSFRGMLHLSYCCFGGNFRTFHGGHCLLHTMWFP